MKIVIIGSGIAGVTFAEKYRALSEDAEITLVSREKDGYYSRPLLSRGFTENDIEKEILIESFLQLQSKGIQVICGAEVTKIKRETQRIYFTDGVMTDSLSYQRLIIATGSAAFIPPPFREFQDNFFLLNSLQDLKKLRRFRQALFKQQKTPHWAVIGGGLIGCEIASDLAVAGDKITLFHAMDRLMERQLVEEDSALLLEVMENSGIEVFLNQTVRGFPKNRQQVSVSTTQSEAAFDAVLVACGFKPRTKLAADAGLETARGIKVNQFLQSGDANIYALGDVAELPNGKLYAFIKPINHQTSWLARYLAGEEKMPWTAPEFHPYAKVHGFEARHAYVF